MTETKRSVTEMSALEFQGLVTLAVRNGVLAASAVLAVISLLIGLFVWLAHS